MPGTYKRTEEIKKKMKRASLKYYASGWPGAFKGKHHTPETKEKLRQVQLAYNQRLRESGIPHHSIGHICSEETIRKMSLAKKGKYAGPKHPCWKGGRKISYGYIYVKCPDHPGANSLGYIREHRLVMEKGIGRILKPTEHVHHINGNKTDNRLENLMLFSSNREHGLYRESRRICPHCGGKL